MAVAELPRIVARKVDVGTVVNLHLQVHDRIREAAMVLWKQPKTAEERYLQSGSRCSWPPYVRDWHAYGADRAKMPKIPPQPREIDRCDEVLGWVSWLASQGGECSDEAIIVWRSFGMNERTKDTARRLGMHRQTVRFKRKSGIKKIVERFYGEII
jgi:hypothetical protein